MDGVRPVNYFLCARLWDGSEKAVLFRPGQTLRVGRDPTNDLSLRGTSVSRFHFAVRHDGCEVVIFDTDSRCGTRVNGTQIRGETPLREGDEISLGRLHLWLKTALDSPPA